MSGHEVVEKLWKSAGFTIHVVKLPTESLNDKLAVLSDGTGKLTSVRYDQFLLNSCIISDEKIFKFFDSLGDNEEQILEAANQLRSIIIEENQLLDPMYLIFNNENLIKIYDIETDGEDVRRVIDNTDWTLPEFNDYDGPTDSEIEEFFRNMPPMISIPGISDPNKLEVVVWGEADLLVVLVKYEKSDLPDIFKDKYVFPHKEAYMAYIVSKCVQDLSQLSKLLEQMDKTSALGGADKVIEKLYDLCIEHNKFLAWEEIDLERVKRMVYRKHGGPKRGTPSRLSDTKSGSSLDTEMEDTFKEFEDLTEEEVLSLNNRMKDWVIGQDEAIDAICESIELASCGMKELHSPIGVFMLTGESGVGKTWSARMLAQELCGNEHSIIRIDCSEYSQPHEVSKLIGAPSGYVGYDDGGYLTNALTKAPFSVILFDEIEKAHSKLHNILLQAMDEGRLTSNKGETVSFGQTVILMTSNLGVKEVSSINNRVGVGDVSKLTHEKRSRAINEALKNKFKPEFLNRIDGIITFNGLKRDHCMKIIRLAFKRVNEWLADRNVEVVCSDDAAEYIYKEGFTPGFGARPLKRAMKKEVMIPISRAMLKEKKRDNCIITLLIENGNIEFNFEAKEPVVEFKNDAVENNIKEGEPV